MVHIEQPGGAVGIGVDTEHHALLLTVINPPPVDVEPVGAGIDFDHDLMFGAGISKAVADQGIIQEYGLVGPVLFQPYRKEIVWSK